MPSKHQPDFSYLRHVPLRKVHLFTLVQVACLAVLWILKSTFLAIIFPVMVSPPQTELNTTGTCWEGQRRCVRKLWSFRSWV